MLPLADCAVGGVGSIQVSSTPPGASIVLDETDSGLTTPATLTGIVAGFHTVRLKLAMESDWGPKSIQVISGKTVQVGGTLRYPGGLVFLPQEQYDSMPPLRPTGAPTELPARVDLRNLFPPPGDQGLTQPSCVGWAVGYGLKTYQERLAHGWSLSSDSHLMSPSFIYNQIREPGGGALLYKALELVLTEGDASLA
ncbi:MAG TPA: PEGA domain-containing protein, partial [Spirochaetia bacterium]|nr:PEGA domain-containing protein [Spirochaetia bacterium]